MTEAICRPDARFLVRRRRTIQSAPYSRPRTQLIAEEPVYAASDRVVRCRSVRAPQIWAVRGKPAIIAGRAATKYRSADRRPGWPDTGSMTAAGDGLHQRSCCARSRTAHWANSVSEGSNLDVGILREMVVLGRASS